MQMKFSESTKKTYSGYLEEEEGQEIWNEEELAPDGFVVLKSPITDILHSIIANYDSIEIHKLIAIAGQMTKGDKKKEDFFRLLYDLSKEDLKEVLENSLIDISDDYRTLPLVDEQKVGVGSK